MRRARSTAAVAAALVLTACSHQVTGKPQSQADVSAMKVTATHKVPVHQASALSPDGRRIAVVGDSGLCVMGVDGSGQVCQQSKALVPDSMHYVWSPDGAHIVVTDDYFRDLLEPDIWVMDTASGAVRDLTDDKVGKVAPGNAPANATLDLLPSWSSDSKNIYFMRQTGNDREHVALESVPAAGGPVTKLGSIFGNVNSSGALVFSSDGAKVAWTTGQSDGTVHVRDVKGGSETTLPSKKGFDRTLLSFSPDSKYLLVDSVVPYASYTSTSGDPTVLPVGGGKPESVASDSSASYPTWAPDSDAIAFVHLDFKHPPSQVRVVAEPGGKSRTLRKATELGAPPYRLNWAGHSILDFENGEPCVLTLQG
jgi:Tol biopolymer transport system component